MFDPFEFETRALAALDAADTTAHHVADVRHEYTPAGLSALWERSIKPTLQAVEPLQTELTKAIAGIEATERRHREELLPAGEANSADELKYTRISRRLKGDLTDYQYAVDVLRESVGTTFAALWVDEMTHAGIFDGVEGVKKALVVVSDEYAATDKAMTLAATVTNGVLKPLIERTLQAAKESNAHRVPADTTMRPEALTAAVTGVGAVVAPGFMWDTAGIKRPWGATKPETGREHAQRVRNEALSAAIDQG